MYENPNTMNRSTKGASKHRRDLINAEILYLRDILPLPETARSRLSQLQIMSMACVYIRKSNYFDRILRDQIFSFDEASDCDFAQCLPGFLLIATRDGKLLYISGNVTDYLGHSMVDMLTQGDSIYDIMDQQDHSSIQRELLRVNYDTQDEKDQRSFFCRINMSKNIKRHNSFAAQKIMHVQGRYIKPMMSDQYGEQPVFLAICTPLLTPDTKESILLNNPFIFRTTHKLDMKFLDMDPKGEPHLGLKPSDIHRQSWYEYVHPEDLTEASLKHSQLLQSAHEMGTMTTLRLLTHENSYIWVNCVMHICQPFSSDFEEAVIECINQVIDEEDVLHYKTQCSLYSDNVSRRSEFFPQPIHYPGPGSSPHSDFYHDSTVSSYPPTTPYPDSYTGHMFAIHSEGTRDDCYTSGSNPSNKPVYLPLDLSSSGSHWPKRPYDESFSEVPNVKRPCLNGYYSASNSGDVAIAASDIPQIDIGLRNSFKSFALPLNNLKLNIKQELLSFDGPPTPETPSVKYKLNVIFSRPVSVPEYIMSPQSTADSMHDTTSPSMTTPVASPFVSSESDYCEAGSPQLIVGQQKKTLPVIDVDILDRFFASFDNSIIDPVADVQLKNEVFERPACRMACQERSYSPVKAGDDAVTSVSPSHRVCSPPLGINTCVTAEFTLVDVNTVVDPLVFEEQSALVDEPDLHQMYIEEIPNSSHGNVPSMNYTSQKL